MAKVTISIPEEMNERIESDLSYGDSRSEWIRQAVRYRFVADDVLGEELDDEEKLDRVRAALADHAGSS
jgi:Arc/MetJ-type ribon-helix-helix transcriptional regulator